MNQNPIAKTLARMNARIAELERRLANTVRHGPVTDVDPAKQLVRVAVGKSKAGEDQKSAWIPYGQHAGALKVHAPPSVGQNMTLFSPGGDIAQAVAVPMTWNDDNESPGDSADVNVLTFGDVTINVEGGGVRVSVGGFELLISGAGLAMAGGGVGHNGQDIGSTHKHPDVMPGGADTGTPIASGPTP